jgi:hypothetical protein
MTPATGWPLSCLTVPARPSACATPTERQATATALFILNPTINISFMKTNYLISRVKLKRLQPDLRFTWPEILSTTRSNSSLPTAQTAQCNHPASITSKP